MSEPLKDPLGKAYSMNPPLKDPLGMDESPADLSESSELSDDEELCLDRIESVRQESLHDPDDVAAILGYFAAGNMELALRYGSGLRKFIASRSGPLHEVLELHPMLRTNVGLVRQYQRDLDLAQRLKHATRKAANSNGTFRPRAGPKPS